jgi:ATP synthase protein I
LEVRLKKNSVALVIGAQLAVATSAGLITLWLGDGRAAMSAFIGGVISVLGTSLFALRVFAGRARQSAKRLLRAFYMGEVQKILLTAVLFVLVIKYVDVSFLPLFVAYAATLLVYWLVLPFTLSETG